MKKNTRISTSLFTKALLTASIFGLSVTLSQAGFSVADYFVDRGHDFMDIFRLRAGVPQNGEGYGVKARATSLAQVGYVNFDGYYSGINRRGIGTSHEDRTEGGVSVLYFSEHTMETTSGNVFLDESTDWSFVRDRRLERNRPYWDDGQGDPLGVGAEVATPIIALDLGVYPGEAFDFVAGIFAIDAFRDDRNTLSKRPWDPMEPTTGPEPDLEASTRERIAELDLIRGGFVSGDDMESEIEVEVEEVYINTTGQVEEKIDDAETETMMKDDGSLDQENVNEILQNSKPVSREPSSSQPAIVEIPANQ